MVKRLFFCKIPLVICSLLGGRIIDGSPASAGQFPWQVAVYFRTSSGSFFCGGSLISASYVLTAGHCAQG